MEKTSKIKFNLIIILAIILFAIAIIPKTLQEDTYYMIKVGEYICENGMQVIVDRIEPFAWHSDMIYTYPHWLLDVVFYLIYSLAGFGGIYGFTIMVGIVIYLLIYYTNVKVCKNNIISAIIALISIWVLQGFITARAQIITYLSCILTILFIERFLESKKKRYIIGLVLVPIVLANCHAALFPIYFVLYLPYIAEYIVSFLTKKEVLNRILKIKNKKLHKLKEKNNTGKVEKLKEKIAKLEDKISKIKENKQSKIIIKRNENVKWLMIIFVICLITGLITPLRDIPYTYTLKSLKGNTMNFISEHQAVTLIRSPHLLITFAVVVVLLFPNKIKIRLQDVFMLAGMSLLALISYKQFPIFWIGVMCIINKLIMMLINENIKEKVFKILKKVLSWKGIVYTIMVITIIFLWRYERIAEQSYVNTNEYPVVASEWIKNNLDMDKVNLFNDFNYGSYLLFKDIPVFIDGRADAYDPVFNGREEDVFLDYMMATSGQTWYGDIFNKYKITHIITTKDSLIDMQLRKKCGI